VDLEHAEAKQVTQPEHGQQAEALLSE